jgi:hypothetical protein
VEKGSVRFFGHDAAVVLGSALPGNLFQIKLADCALAVACAACHAMPFDDQFCRDATAAFSHSGVVMCGLRSEEGTP